VERDGAGSPVWRASGGVTRAKASTWMCEPRACRARAEARRAGAERPPQRSYTAPAAPRLAIGPGGGGVPMTIRVNGEPRSVDRALRIAELVRSMVADDPEGVAVAVNGEIVTRSRWHEREVRDGDDIEIVRATQGG
jgi:sulfur carrier protein